MPCHDLNECLGASNLEENELFKVKIVTRACVAALEIWMAGAQDVDAGVGWGRAYLGKESQVLPCLEMCCQILGTPQE